MQGHSFLIKVKKNTISRLPADVQPTGGPTTWQGTGMGKQQVPNICAGIKYALFDSKADPRRPQIMPFTHTFLSEEMRTKANFKQKRLCCCQGRGQHAGFTPEVLSGWGGALQTQFSVYSNSRSGKSNPEHCMTLRVPKDQHLWALEFSWGLLVLMCDGPAK